MLDRRHAQHARPRPLAWIAAVSVFAAGCGGGGLDDARTAEIAAVMTRADLPLLRARPAHVAGKYALMASDPYSFFRGTVPLYLHDFRNDRDGIGTSAFAADTPLVLSLGDAHIENFGILIAADGTLAVEPNDFDGADRTVYLWDVRRLAVTMAFAARLAGPEDPAARDTAVQAAPEIAFEAARSYAEAMRDLAAGAPPSRADDPGDSEILNDLFDRSIEDAAARAELTELTTLGAGGRRLVRGILDTEVPSHVLRDLPPSFLAALPQTLEAYRGTLIDPPPPDFFTVKDAARELGTGVASYPRVRALVLVRGPTDAPDDDVILELKELPDSAVLSHPPPEVHHDSVQDRILETTRAAWAIPAAAPLWGTSEIAGFPVQIRLESAGQKTLRARRLVGERGTPAELMDLAGRLGVLLARIHAAPVREGDPSPAPDIAAVIGDDLDAFGAEHAKVADRAAEGVLQDFERFRIALDQLGPTLGVPFDPADAPSPDLSALFDGLEPGK